MYKLSNISLTNYSIIAGKISGSNIPTSGIMDMPERIGKVAHDWQDDNGIEPYVGATELFWAGRDIEFTGILNASTRGEAESYLASFYNNLRNLSGLVVFETPHGNFNVYVNKGIKVVWLDYQGFCTINFTLREPVIAIPTPIIPTGALPNVYGIDSIAFSSFGIYLEKATLGNLSRPETNSGVFKAYENEGFQLTKPKVKSIDISLIATGANFADLKTNIELLFAILAQSGLRNLNIDGRILQAYNTKGFKVTDITETDNLAVARITLPMDLYEEIVSLNKFNYTLNFRL